VEHVPARLRLRPAAKGSAPAIGTVEIAPDAIRQAKEHYAPEVV
jgi:hypothetical protein